MTELDLTKLLGEHASAHSVPGAAIGALRDGLVTTAYTGVADTMIMPLANRGAHSSGEREVAASRPRL